MKRKSSIVPSSGYRSAAAILPVSVNLYSFSYPSGEQSKAIMPSKVKPIMPETRINDLNHNRSAASNPNRFVAYGSDAGSDHYRSLSSSAHHDQSSPLAVLASFSGPSDISVSMSSSISSGGSSIDNIIQPSHSELSTRTIGGSHESPSVITRAIGNTPPLPSADTMSTTLTVPVYEPSTSKSVAPPQHPSIADRPRATRKYSTLETTTMYGFMDFTTTISGTKVIFTPRTDSPVRPEPSRRVAVSASTLPSNAGLNQPALPVRSRTRPSQTTKTTIEPSKHIKLSSIGTHSSSEILSRPGKYEFIDFNPLHTNSVGNGGPISPNKPHRASYPPHHVGHKKVSHVQQHGGPQVSATPSASMPTGLLSSLSGTVEVNNTLTEWTTLVIGTFIQGTYAHILQSKSRIYEKMAKSEQPNGIRPSVTGPRVDFTPVPVFTTRYPTHPHLNHPHQHQQNRPNVNSDNNRFSADGMRHDSVLSTNQPQINGRGHQNVHRVVNVVVGDLDDDRGRPQSSPKTSGSPNYQHLQPVRLSSPSSVGPSKGGHLTITDGFILPKESSAIGAVSESISPSSSSFYPSQLIHSSPSSSSLVLSSSYFPSSFSSSPSSPSSSSSSSSPSFVKSAIPSSVADNSVNFNSPPLIKSSLTSIESISSIDTSSISPGLVISSPFLSSSSFYSSSLSPIVSISHPPPSTPLLSSHLTSTSYVAPSISSIVHPISSSSIGSENDHDDHDRRSNVGNEKNKIDTHSHLLSDNHDNRLSGSKTIEDRSQATFRLSSSDVAPTPGTISPSFSSSSSSSPSSYTYTPIRAHVTTYTYSTTYFKDGSMVVSSHEETVTNTMKPGSLISSLITPSDTISLQTIPSSSTYPPLQLQSVSLAPSPDTSTFSASSSPFLSSSVPGVAASVSPSFNHEPMSTPKLSSSSSVTLSGSLKPFPVTYFTTYTYYYTTYLGNGKSTVKSREETISRISTPGIDEATSAIKEQPSITMMTRKPLKSLFPSRSASLPLRSTPLASRSATIKPSKTIYTTYTYFTTYLKAGSRSVASRLETVTNVVPMDEISTDVPTNNRRLRPSGAANFGRIKPTAVTQYTTYTLYTTYESNGQTHVSTSKHTVSNVVPPSINQANPSQPVRFGGRRGTRVRTVIKPTSTLKTDVITFTYFTTLINRGIPVVSSRFETVTTTRAADQPSVIVGGGVDGRRRDGRLGASILSPSNVALERIRATNVPSLDSSRVNDLGTEPSVSQLFPSQGSPLNRHRDHHHHGHHTGTPALPDVSRASLIDSSSSSLPVDDIPSPLVAASAGSGINSSQLINLNSKCLFNILFGREKNASMTVCLLFFELNFFSGYTDMRTRTICFHLQSPFSGLIYMPFCLPNFLFMIHKLGQKIANQGFHVFRYVVLTSFSIAPLGFSIFVYI